MKLKGYSIAVLGGDSRELYLINDLASKGAEIFAVGFEQKRHSIKGKVIYSLKDSEDEVDAIILPFPGIDSAGNVKAKYTNRKLNYKSEFDALERIPATLVGYACPTLKEYFKARNGTLLEMADKDEVAILNSIPTAEGAVALAIENTPFTIHCSHVLVLGFGRCAISLVNLLLGLKANVTVVARRPSDFARASEMGAHSLSFKEFEQADLKKYRLIFNTVPYFVLKETIINGLSQGSVIIDIASGEGGTDFEACSKRQIKAVHAKGIPGKYSPESAANILGRVYPRILKTYLGR